MQIKKKLILASRSPRRQRLLEQLGVQFETRESGINEDEHPLVPPEQYVESLAQKKAEAVGKLIESGLVIGADTVVVFEDRILGKPVDADDAQRMLRLLSGRTHTVYTGISILDRPSNWFAVAHETTRVSFRRIADSEIFEYVASGSPMDKAGAYGIQDDYGAVFVERIEGCFYNVVGFPLARFQMMLERFQRQLQEAGLLED